MKQILFSVLILPNILFGMDHITKQTKNKLKPVIATCLELSNELVEKKEIDQSNALFGAYLEIHKLLHNQIELSKTIKEIADQAYQKSRNAPGNQKAFDNAIIMMRPDHSSMLRYQFLTDALVNLSNKSKIKDLKLFLAFGNAEQVILDNATINEHEQKEIAIAYAYLHMKEVDAKKNMLNINGACLIQ